MPIDGGWSAFMGDQQDFSPTGGRSQGPATRRQVSIGRPAETSRPCPGRMWLGGEQACCSHDALWVGRGLTLQPRFRPLRSVPFDSARDGAAPSVGGDARRRRIERIATELFRARIGNSKGRIGQRDSRLGPGGGEMSPAAGEIPQRGPRGASNSSRPGPQAGPGCRRPVGRLRVAGWRLIERMPELSRPPGF